MKIGIVGTRGIPNRYGGFEQFAERFSVRMAEKGHDITVYTSHHHPYTASCYKGVKLVRCYDPENMLGTTGQFIYDFNCIKNARKQNFDIILQLGYTSSTIWSWLYPKSAVLVTNMDGLEWTRGKYNKLTQHFLTYAEKWGVKYSDYLIADSRGIEEYLSQKFNAQPVYISYGADIFEPGDHDISVLKKFSLDKCAYDLLIARFEPENNIETILKAYASFEDKKLVLVGDYTHTSFGRRLYNEYSFLPNLQFIGALFNVKQLNTLRYYSNLYIHGHSAGGTNPSLLEAMGCNALICAHDNIFNKHILNEDAFYFKTTNDLRALLSCDLQKSEYANWLEKNLQKITNSYNWDIITEEIESYFKKWCHAEMNKPAVVHTSAVQPVIKTYRSANDSNF